MNTRLLDLHFAQLTKAWKRSKYNTYSDSEKENYHKKLQAIYGFLEKEDFSSFDNNEISGRFKAIDFIFKSLEFLDSSTLNLIPFEIVECLQTALIEWINPVTDKLIIVTSLVNRIDGFSFDPSLAANNLIYDNIKGLCNIDFDSKLIQINVPINLSKDYLANVVLYHELGHFVDTKFQISNSIYDNLLKGFFDGTIINKDKADLLSFFPYLDHPQSHCLYSSTQNILHFQSHIAEYFCDLFAAQYIEDCSNQYLGYITEMSADFSYTHPSTVKRVELVNKFLKVERDSFFLNKITETIKLITGNDLVVRYQKFTSDNFLHLVPVDIENKKELHYLFIHGWEHWLNSQAKFKDYNNMSEDIKNENLYDVLNNLIEKSIGNFVVSSKWKEANDALS